MEPAGCDVHHTGPGAAGLPRHRGSRREPGLAAQFTAVFTGHAIRCAATPRKTAAGADSPSGLCGYGDHEQGAHPVAAMARARCGRRRRGDGSALTEGPGSAIQPEPPGGGRRLRPGQAAGE